MNTDWSDIDDEGGHLDFNTIALAIEKWIMEKKPKKECTYIDLPLHNENMCQTCQESGALKEWQEAMEENK